MSSIINPRNNWLGALGLLLGGSLEKQYKSFHDCLDSVAKHVIHKSGPRLISKTFRDADRREKMIEHLFKKYSQGMTTTELCNSAFMRKIVKRDRMNEANLEFIHHFVTPALIKHFPDAVKLMKDPAVRFWMREFCATTMEPQSFCDQREILKGIPKKVVSRFITARNEVNDSLVEATVKGWIDRLQMDLIMVVLKEKKKIEKTEIIFSKETAVHYLINQYDAVINAGGEFANQFRASILMNLLSIQNNLGVIKAPATAHPTLRLKN